MKRSVRLACLFTLLAATAVAAIWPDSGEGETPQPRRHRTDPTAAPAPTTSPNVAIAETAAPAPHDRLDGDAAGGDPFGVRNWAPPPAPPPPAAAAPIAAAPTAPPLPFTYAGRLEAEPGRWTIYLVRGEQTFAVTKGDEFDGTYRFDGEENGSLLIRFLPLSVTQKLQLSKEN